MKLYLDYLKQRYNYWKNEIGRAGIWDPDRFEEVSIHIRPKSKSYNGLFSRKWLLRNGKKVLVDRIFIYNNSEDFNPLFLDSILVHEMIHQYVFQNKIKDTSTHGKVFRNFMAKINQEFRGRLSINISDHNPLVPLTGPGNKLHSLVLSFTDSHCYCCVINPNKVETFDKILKKLKKAGQIKQYVWATSNDMYFERFVRCTKTLHGVRHPISELSDFCKKYNVIRAVD